MDQDLQSVVSWPVWVLGRKSRSSGRSVCTLTTAPSFQSPVELILEWISILYSFFNPVFYLRFLLLFPNLQSLNSCTWMTHHMLYNLLILILFMWIWIYAIYVQQPVEARRGCQIKIRTHSWPLSHLFSSTNYIILSLNACCLTHWSRRIPEKNCFFFPYTYKETESQRD